ncbi:MAG: hypothetical protein ACC657_12280 [Thiohalomonadales bacterium]
MIKVNYIILASLVTISMLMMSNLSMAAKLVSFSDPNDPCLSVTGSDSLTPGFNGGKNTIQGSIRKFNMYADMQTPCTVDYMSIGFKVFNRQIIAGSDGVFNVELWTLIENTSAFTENSKVNYLDVSLTYEATRRGSSANNPGNSNSPRCMEVTRHLTNSGVNLYDTSRSGRERGTGGTSRTC